MKLKILHITASYKPAYIYGGPIQSVAKLCESIVKHEDQRARNKEQRAVSQKWKLESRKFDLEVFTTTANGQNELAVECGKSILVVGVLVTYFKRWTKDHSHFSPGLLWRLRKVLRHFDKLSAGLAQHDKFVIHIHAWWNLVSVLSCLVAKWYNVPVVLSPRGMLTTYSQHNRNSLAKRVIHYSIGKRLLRYCHIHTTSAKEKRDVLQLVQPKSIRVIPNLVDVKGADKLKAESVKIKAPAVEQPKAESLKTKMQSANHTSIFKLLFLSRIEEKKGLELLLEALATLNIQYHLTIAGSGEENYVESLKLKAESLKLGNRIVWIGKVSNEEKFSIMADHDLLVLPSYNENFANVVIECLSVGTPVLISENVGLSDYVEANDLGWICSLEPKDIATKITKANTDAVKRDSIIRVAPGLIRSDFNNVVLAKCYMELYEEILQLH